MTFFFDMDGTIADFYGVDGWLDYLKQQDTTPYEIAAPLVGCGYLAKMLNGLQSAGNKIAILSWLSKNGTPAYNEEITRVKREWLSRHLPSVTFDHIFIIPHGFPKGMYADSYDAILFDDEEANRKNWPGKAYDQTELTKILWRYYNEAQRG